MNKQQTIHNAKDIYQAFARQLLAENPEWWGKPSKAKKMKNAFIYRKQGGRIIEVMNFDRWYAVIKFYMIQGRRLVIEGGVLNLGNYLGRIQARRIDRNFSNPQVNWKETMKQEPYWDHASGKWKRKPIYFTDDEYARIKWEKLKKIPNEMVYEFVPCGGNGPNKGFKGEFIFQLQQNPILITRYKRFRNGVQLSQP